jgi:hypothetical protein
MLAWLQRGLNDSRPGMGAALGAMDSFVNPAAARAREILDEQHERVMPTPSPGDRMLKEGRIIIKLPPKEA